jgi:hypothetical protein
MNNQNTNASTDKPVAVPVAPLLKAASENAASATPKSDANMHKDGSPEAAPEKAEPKQDATSPETVAPTTASAKN